MIWLVQLVSVYYLNQRKSWQYNAEDLMMCEMIHVITGRREESGKGVAIGTDEGSGTVLTYSKVFRYLIHINTYMIYAIGTFRMIHIYRQSER
jgi:hypothetical protein